MKASVRSSASEEALRGELPGGLVRGGGEKRQRPVEIPPRVDLQELAGADDGIQDGGVVAGVGVTDEEPVVEAQLRGPDLPLDGIIIDLEMAVARFGKEGQFAPALEAVVNGLAEETLGQDRRIGARRTQPQVQLQEQRDGALSPEFSAVDRVHAASFGLKAVQGPEIIQERRGAVIARLQRRDKASPCMRQARSAHDLVARQGRKSGVVSGIPVGLQDAGEAVQDGLGRSVATVFMKLENDTVLLRAMDGPQPGVADLAAPLGVEERDRGLVHLDVATVQDGRTQGRVDGGEESGDVRNPLPHGLAGKGGAHARQDLFLSVYRDVIAVLGNDHVGDQARAGLAAGNHPRGQGRDHRGGGVGGTGVDRPNDLAAKEDPGTVVDLGRDLLTDDDQGGAVGGNSFLDGRLQADGLQDGQLIHPTLPALGGGARLGRNRGNLLLEEVISHHGPEGQVQLVGIQLLAAATEVLPQKRLHLALHLFDLQLEETVFLLQGLEPYLQLGRVVGQVGAHVSMYWIP